MDGKLFIETVRIEQGRVCDAGYHNLRMNRTRAFHFGKMPEPWQIETMVKAEPYVERTRCRILYGREVEKIEFFPYTPRKVDSLRLVEGGGVDYRFKYADRSALDALFAQREGADEVLIVKDGLLTDTTIANIALWNGCEWHTPARPLLEGTCRMRLLEARRIVAKDIRVEQLAAYSKIRLFNAMLPWGEVELRCEDVMSFCTGK